MNDKNRKRIQYGCTFRVKKNTQYNNTLCNQKNITKIFYRIVMLRT